MKVYFNPHLLSTNLTEQDLNRPGFRSYSFDLVKSVCILQSILIFAPPSDFPVRLNLHFSLLLTAFHPSF